MAKRGTTKRNSTDQEDFIAEVYKGKRSPSSGAAERDKGDVRTEEQLIECKQTGTFEKPAQSISVKVADFEKIADEAYAEGRYPCLALRIYSPDSLLADSTGNIDIIARLVKDDLL